MARLIISAIAFLACALCSKLTIEQYSCEKWTSNNSNNDRSILGRRVNRAVIAKDNFAGIVNMHSKQFTKIDAMLSDLLYAGSLREGVLAVGQRCYRGAFVVRKSPRTNNWLLVTCNDGDVKTTLSLGDINHLEWITCGRFNVTKYTSSPGDRITVSYTENGAIGASIILSFH